MLPIKRCIMSELTYSELNVEAFPEGEYSIIWYNNINKYKSKTRDYFVKLVLENIQTGELKALDRNIKEIPALPLGSIIMNKKLTLQKQGELYNFTFQLNNPQQLIKVPSKFFQEPIEYFKKLDRKKISLSNGNEYSVGYHSSSQQGLLLLSEDRSVFFPSYVIAQYFYFRSSSLIKQIMSYQHKHGDAVKGLYRSIERDEYGNTKILLLPGSSPDDAPEILRFSEINPYGNKLFHQIYNDLVDSHLKNKKFYEEKGWGYPYNSAVLRTNFPVLGNINMTFRGIQLTNNEYLALEIIQENSVYPFDTLTIFRESPKRKDKIIPEGMITTNRFRSQDITKNVNDLTPNTMFEHIQVSNDAQEDGRMDLKDKRIVYEKIKIESDAELTKITEDINAPVNLNSDHEESNGDDRTTQINPSYDGDILESTNVDREVPDLDDFKIMLYYASQQYENFSYTLSSHMTMPVPGKKGKKQWIRAYLTTGERRSYMTATINYQGKMYCAIEIEKDPRIIRASTLILRMDDFSKVPDDLIRSILLNYVEMERHWLYGIEPDNYSSATLMHPRDTKEDSINKWTDRFIIALQAINK